jgi:flavodoxin
MKAVIVYDSRQDGNTEKVARAMADELGAMLIRAKDAKPEMLADCRLVGFGSGIMMGKPYGNIMGFVGKLPAANGKNAFIFSCSGSGEMKMHSTLRNKVAGKGFNILGEFCCKGEFSKIKFLFFEMKMKDPMNLGKPDADDLKNAREFVKGMTKK